MSTALLASCLHGIASGSHDAASIPPELLSAASLSASGTSAVRAAHEKLTALLITAASRTRRLQFEW